MFYAIDFDGTCVKDRYPHIGEDVPHCVEVLFEIINNGGKIILNTLRSNSNHTLADAVNWFEERGVELYGVNHNPMQKAWSSSPKIWGNVYIDDAAIGTPLIYDDDDNPPYVDWIKVKRLLIDRDLL